MAGSRQTNTFGEALQKMLRDLADMKIMPDADLEFILDLETRVIGKLRGGIDAANGTGSTQVPGDPGLGQAIGMQGQMPDPAMMSGQAGGAPMGMPGMPPVQPPDGVNGVRSMPQMPNPDELRRILQQ